jgi:hypothetical protein
MVRMTWTLVFAAFVFTANAGEVRNEVIFEQPIQSGSFIARAASKALSFCLQRFGRSGLQLLFIPQADGGSDGSDSSDSSDSSSSTSSDDNSGPSDNSGLSDSSAGDPSVAVNESATDPANTVNDAMDPATQQAYDAVTNPFGGYPGPLPPGTENAFEAGSVAGSPIGSLRPGEPGPLPPGTTTRFPPQTSEPGPPEVNAPSRQRAQIHAVIVSSLPDPSQVLSGNVNLTGGIVAMGSANPNAPQRPGRWDPNVTITPDPDLLNGNKIPPLVPNVFDVHIMHHEVSATIESTGTISDRP